MATLLMLEPLRLSLLQRLVALGDDPFVGNSALIAFVLSPVGAVSVAVAAITGILLLAIEFGGACLIAWDGLHFQPLLAGRVWRRLLPRLPALLAISAAVLLTVVVLALPVIGAALAAKAFFLSDADIYFYLTTRPPAFLRAAMAVGLVAVVMLVIALLLLQRYCLSVPICLLEPTSARTALRRSAGAMRGRRLALLWPLAIWLTATLAAWAGAAAAIAGSYEWLAAADRSLVGLHRLSLGFAVGGSLVLGLLFCVSRAALAVIVVRLYSRSSVAVTVGDAALRSRRPFPMARRAGLVALCVAIPIASVAQAVWATGGFDPQRPVAVTAHRAGSLRAPENSLAALQLAIAEGADYAEIDLQETMDGEIVLLHDTDLRRVAGVARSIWQVNYADIAALDSGSWFDRRFAAERIPTLRGAIAAAKGRIRLNLELKVNPHEVDLAGRVVAILRETGAEDAVILSSLDFDILRRVRALNPKLKIGFIVATGIGRLANLDVDFFALSRRLATPAVIRTLQKQGRGVHVWTLDDDDAIAGAMIDGADNIITGDPLRAIAVRNWFERLTPPEHALLRLRHAFDRRNLVLADTGGDAD